MPEPTDQTGDVPSPSIIALARRECGGDVSSWRNVSRDHAESHVWSFTNASGERRFIKIHRRARKFEQELHTYRAWVPSIANIAPQLLYAGPIADPGSIREDESSVAIIMTAVPGTVADAVRDMKPKCRTEMMRHAGAAIRRFHDAPFVDRDPVSLADAIAARTTSWCDRACGLIDVADRAWVQDCIADGSMFTGCARVPCHRDYHARNWVITQTGDGDLESFCVIDFEHTRPDCWLGDVVRLWDSAWRDRPHLQDAFFDGYGRPLSDDDEQRLVQVGMIHAVSTIVWAREHRDAAFEAHGRRLLEAIRASKKGR